MTVTEHQDQMQAESQQAYLPWLLQPVSTAEFRREYWDEQSLLIERGDPGYYADLLTLDDVDQLLSTAGDTGMVRVVSDTAPATSLTDLSSRARLAVLYERFRGGASITIDHAEQRYEPLRKLAYRLGAEMSAWINVSIYLTPPGGSSAHAVHYDAVDAFILQAHGAKQWMFFGRPYPHPLTRQYSPAYPAGAEPEQELVLRAGDLFYMPRGTIHRARPVGDSPSVHIVVGIHPQLYADVLADAVQRAALEDGRLRQALPLGWTTDPGLREEITGKLAELTAELARKLSPPRMLAEATRRVVSNGAVPLRYYLLDLEHLGEVGPGTPVRTRPGQLHSLMVVGDTVVLYFSGREARFRATAEPAVRYIATSGNEWLTAAGLPGDLSEANRLHLIKTLISEGFLTFH